MNYFTGKLRFRNVLNEPKVTADNEDSDIEANNEKKKLNEEESVDSIDEDAERVVSKAMQKGVTL